MKRNPFDVVGFIKSNVTRVARHPRDDRWQFFILLLGWFFEVAT